MQIPCTAAAVNMAHRVESHAIKAPEQQSIEDITIRLLGSVESSFITLAQEIEEYQQDAPQTHILTIKQTLIENINTIIAILQKHSELYTQTALITPSLQALHQELRDTIQNINTSTDIHRAAQLYMAILMTYNKEPYKPLEEFFTQCSQQLEAAKRLYENIEQEQKLPLICSHEKQERIAADFAKKHAQLSRKNVDIITEIDTLWRSFAQHIIQERTILTTEYSVHLDIEAIHARRIAQDQHNLTTDQACVYLETPENFTNIQPLQDYIKTLQSRLDILKRRFYAQTAPKNYNLSLLSDQAKRHLLHIRASISQDAYIDATEIITNLPQIIYKDIIGKATETAYTFGTTKALPLITLSNQLIDQANDILHDVNAQFPPLLAMVQTTIESTETMIRSKIDQTEDTLDETTQKALLQTLSKTQDTITRIMQPRDDLSYMPMQALRAGHAITDNNPYLIVEQLRTTLTPLADLTIKLNTKTSQSTHQALTQVKGQLDLLLTFAEHTIKRLEHCSEMISNIQKELNKQFLTLIHDAQICRTIYVTITSRYTGHSLLSDIIVAQNTTRKQLLQKQAEFNSKIQALKNAIQSHQELFATIQQEKLPTINTRIEELATIQEKIKQITFDQEQHTQAIAALQNRLIIIKKTSWLHYITNPLHILFKKLSWLNYGKGITAIVWCKCSLYGRICMEIKRHEKLSNDNIVRLNDLKTTAQRLKIAINFEEAQLKKTSERHKKQHAHITEQEREIKTKKELLEQKNQYIHSIAYAAIDLAHNQQLEKEEREERE